MGESTIDCRYCSGGVRVPELDPAARDAIVALRAVDTVKAIRALIDATGWDYAAAKQSALHLSRRRRQCHRCEGELADRIGSCPHCGSANIDWCADPPAP